MFTNNTLRKYTLALLSTFNNVEVSYTKSDNTVFSNFIPIKFFSREKATIISEHDSKQITEGNFNVLPRMSLVYESMQKDMLRGTNKSLKISKKLDNTTIQYALNAVPWDYNYSIICQARGMNEASQISEQILSNFNPHYTLRINEFPLLTEPSSIPLLLNDITFETEEYDELSTNIVTMTISLTLKGHVFPSIKDQKLITLIKLYTNLDHGDGTYSRAVLDEWNVGTNQEIVSKTSNILTVDGQFAKLVPVINNIILSNNSPVINTAITLTASYVDKDNKPNEEVFVWTIISGIGSVGTGSNVVNFVSSVAGTVKVMLVITDIHGNQSLPFYKDIIVS